MDFPPPRFATVGGRRLAYDEAGGDTPATVLLLCGIGAKRQGYSKQLPALGEGARRVCAAVAAPGWADRHPEEIEAFVAIARYRPMSRDAYLRQLAACVDPLVPLANGEHLAAQVPGARLKVYADCGHIPEVERADEFNADLLGFLA